MVFNHHRTMIQNLLRLKPNTPQSVCYFLSGSLPAEAILHLRQLSILSMIMSAKDSILNKHGLNALNSKSSSRSWFHQVRDICLQYQLPHPMTLLHSSIPKESFRVLARKHVLNYWKLKLRSEAAQLPSLRYFKPEFMSLTKPHPIFLSAGSSPYMRSPRLISKPFSYPEGIGLKGYVAIGHQIQKGTALHPTVPLMESLRMRSIFSCTAQPCLKLGNALQSLP